MAVTLLVRARSIAQVVGRSGYRLIGVNDRQVIDPSNPVSSNERPRQQSCKFLDFHLAVLEHRGRCPQAPGLGVWPRPAGPTGTAVRRLAEALAKMGLPDGRRATRRKPSLRAIASRIGQLVAWLLCAAAASADCRRRRKARGAARHPRQPAHVRPQQTVRTLGGGNRALQVGRSSARDRAIGGPFARRGHGERRSCRAGVEQHRNSRIAQTPKASASYRDPPSEIGRHHHRGRIKGNGSIRGSGQGQYPSWPEETDGIGSVRSQHLRRPTLRRFFWPSEPFCNA
jgi:hypothetical protein